ncbi:hypothetical protein ARMGADRAFT_1077371 [Armillaria gallica]|uniref:Uncharacterized protein n=1 Tax=Armillaria gallica TaxID=47427 RepID=A0A2H3DPP9_ARMGA|nr:hypothetical protein ARMGADRAFT_1077371 [Armillaria gallica]
MSRDAIRPPRLFNGVGHIAARRHVENYFHPFRTVPSPSLTDAFALRRPSSPEEDLRARLLLHPASFFPGHNAQSRVLHLGDAAKACEYSDQEEEQSLVPSLQPLSLQS